METAENKNKNSLDLIFNICKYSGFTSIITVTVTAAMGIIAGAVILPIFVLSIFTLGIGAVGTGTLHESV